MILGMNLGPHALFIEVSYIVTVVIVAALVLWIVLDYAAQRRVLGNLDAQGIRRRSQSPRDDTP
jgi:heme exporter protein D